MQYSTTEGREPRLVVSEGRSHPMMSSIRCEARMSKTAQLQRVRSDGDKLGNVKLMNYHHLPCSTGNLFWFRTYKGTQNRTRSYRWILWMASSSFLTSEVSGRQCRTWRTKGRESQFCRLLNPRNDLFVLCYSTLWEIFTCKTMFFCLNPGSPSYQIEASSCWTLGWATN